MAEIGRGIKTGLVSGMVYGCITTFLILALHALSESSKMTLPLQMSTQELLKFSLLLFVGWLIGGVIFGVLYAVLYKKLLGFGSIAKGFNLSMFVWAIIEIVRSLFYIPVLSVAFINIGALVSSAGLFILDFLLALVGGVMVGSVWNEV